MLTFTTQSLAIPARPIADTFVTLKVVEPFTLLSLQHSEVGQRLMFQYPLSWHEDHWSHWLQALILPGTYQLRLPVVGSNNRIFREQISLLHFGEVVAPLSLTAAALLCIAESGGSDPLNGDRIRCADTVGACRSALVWGDDGKLRIAELHDAIPNEITWLAAAKLV